jgi:hypothetical protein
LKFTIEKSSEWLKLTASPPPPTPFSLQSICQVLQFLFRGLILISAMASTKIQTTKETSVSFKGTVFCFWLFS